MGRCVAVLHLLTQQRIAGHIILISVSAPAVLGGIPALVHHIAIGQLFRNFRHLLLRHVRAGADAQALQLIQPIQRRNIGDVVKTITFYV